MSIYEEGDGLLAVVRDGLLAIGYEENLPRLFRNFRAGTPGRQRISGWVQSTCTLNCRNARGNDPGLG
jgi:hypothetical protein